MKGTFLKLWTVPDLAVRIQTTLGEEFNDPLFQRGLLDVHMMVVHDGAERTVPHWCATPIVADFLFDVHYAPLHKVNLHWCLCISFLGKHGLFWIHFPVLDKGSCT